uniref:Uncharacterized protein n=1 Tax=Anguilla anguilla TaxID=7936 RepID=A0A0E9XGI5_ANGAN
MADATAILTRTASFTNKNTHTHTQLPHLGLFQLTGSPTCP